MKPHCLSLFILLSLAAVAVAQTSIEKPDAFPVSELPRCGIQAGSLPPSLRGGPACPDSVTLLRGYPADDGSTVDLMVVYTAAARDAAGGVAAIESRIDTAVANTNQYFANSLINTEIRVVRKALISYAESGDGITDLNRLVITNDGILDSVHADRDTYGADLVSLWVSSLNAGGVAYQLFAYGLEDDGRYGFSVLRQDQYNIETLAHEIGHNFGCQHDRDNLAGIGFYNYSYGYREPGNVWKDIMAYPPGTTIPFFSNPDLTYTGPLGNHGPMGVPGNDPDASCNNALTINNLAWTLANFRPSTLPAPPTARLYVRAAAPPGGSGASWATAMNDLQEAICKAVQSRGVVTNIWVAAGTYKPDRGLGDRLISFRLVNGVSIYGGFAGTETSLAQRNIAANVTVLSGDIGLFAHHLDNTYHVVDGRDLGPTAVLDGFTIMNGYADGAYPHDNGGGLRNRCGSPTFANCEFLDNYALYGGAVSNSDGSSPTFTQCQFYSNAAFQSAAGVSNSNSTPTFTSCAFTGNSAPSHAAFECFTSASPTLTDCTFSENIADWGGAIGVYGASITMDDCTLTDNSSVNGGGGIIAGADATLTIQNSTLSSNDAVFGGGIYCHSGASAFIDNCTFDGNIATGTGGGLYTYIADPVVTNCYFYANESGSGFSGAGGGVAFSTGSQPTLTDCTFESNRAYCCGGALADFDSSPTLSNCVFLANYALYGAGVWDADSGSSPEYYNCSFYGNDAAFGGGAIHTTNGSTPLFAGAVFSGNRSTGWGGVSWSASGSAPQFRNCTLAGNVAQYDSGGLNNDGAVATLENCILWGNSDDTGVSQDAQIQSTSATAVINYTIIQSWNNTLGGTGNNGANPLFVDQNGDDNLSGTLDDNVRVPSGSSAIDSGRNSGIPLGLTTDTDGNPRLADDPATTDTGVGTPPIVDRGAYEFPVAACAPCDTNCNGTVNAFDIQPFVDLLISPIPPPCSSCAGDTNLNGTVNTFDINDFIACLVG